MALVSMACGGEGYTEIPDNPYGYGLSISLTEEQVEALGLDKNPPPAGTKVTLQAVATVTKVTQESDPAEEVAEGEEAGDVDVRLVLQITELDVTGPGLSMAQRLYGMGVTG